MEDLIEKLKQALPELGLQQHLNSTYTGYDARVVARAVYHLTQLVVAQHVELQALRRKIDDAYTDGK